MFSLHIIDVVSTLPCGEIPIHYKRRNKLLKRDHESWFEPDSHHGKCINSHVPTWLLFDNESKIDRVEKGAHMYETKR
jgi:hypothetical protein